MPIDLDEDLETVESNDPAAEYMRLLEDLLAHAGVLLPVTSISYLDNRGIPLPIPGDN